MTEAQLYEEIGRQAVLLKQQQAAYKSILGVLGGVIGGGIDSSRVLVNLTAESWNVVPIGERPGMPATINGVPVCVVAPEPPPPEPKKPETIPEPLPPVVPPSRGPAEQRGLKP